jgi:hypothetical protein
VNQNGIILDLSIAENIDKIDDENFKNAFKTLISTMHGEALITLMNTKYDNHDIYIGRSKLHTYHNEAVASTQFGAKSKSINTIYKVSNILAEGYGYNSFSSVNFSRSKDKLASLILLPLNTFNIGVNTNWDGNKYVSFSHDKYDLAESIYHEIWAHILYKIEHPSSEDEIHHQSYGSYNSGLDMERELHFYNDPDLPISVAKNVLTEYKIITGELLQLKQMGGPIEIVAPSKSNKSGSGSHENVRNFYRN